MKTFNCESFIFIMCIFFGVMCKCYAMEQDLFDKDIKVQQEQRINRCNRDRSIADQIFFSPLNRITYHDENLRDENIKKVCDVFENSGNWETAGIHRGDNESVLYRLYFISFVNYMREALGIYPNRPYVFPLRFKKYTSDDFSLLVKKEDEFLAILEDEQDRINRVYKKLIEIINNKLQNSGVIFFTDLHESLKNNKVYWKNLLDFTKSFFLKIDGYNHSLRHAVLLPRFPLIHAEHPEAKLESGQWQVLQTPAALMQKHFVAVKQEAEQHAVTEGKRKQRVFDSDLVENGQAQKYPRNEIAFDKKDVQAKIPLKPKKTKSPQQSDENTTDSKAARKDIEMWMEKEIKRIRKKNRLRDTGLSISN